MTITSDRIWIYKASPMGLELAALGGQGQSTDVIDLSSDREPDWWAGKVACLGGCRRHIYVACVNAEVEQMPRQLLCPICKQRHAVPEIYWGSAYEISCPCGKKTYHIAAEKPPEGKDLRCKRCGGYTTKADRWPIRS